jgi:hypothetical protein
MRKCVTFSGKIKKGNDSDNKNDNMEIVKEIGNHI